MAIILNNYFIKILFINILISYSKEELIENPKFIISDFQYPIIFNGKGSHYNFITSKNVYIIEKLTGKITHISDFDSCALPYFLCVDEYDNYFLYATKDYYKINLDSNSEIIDLQKQSSIEQSVQFTGYIKQYYYVNDNKILGDNRCNVKEREIIFYGKDGNNIYFYYHSAGIGYTAQIN